MLQIPFPNLNPLDPRWDDERAATKPQNDTIQAGEYMLMCVSS